MRVRRITIALVLFVLPSYLLATGQAPSNSELGQVRQDIDQLKREYEQMTQAYEERFKKLDARLKQLESTNPVVTTPLASVSAANKPTTVISPTIANTDQRAPQLQTQAVELQNPFIEPTSSIRLALAEQPKRPVQERLETILRNYVDISGYFRAGYGRDNEGGPQVAFQAPGALAKGRLGNEAENYGELVVSKNFYLPGAFSLTRNSAGAPDTGTVASFQVRISMYNPYQNYGDSNGTQFGLPEAWGAVGHVIAGQPGINVWAGNRYYRRHDVHIDDFFLYNMSGGGGGVEDIQTPIGKLAFAWIGIGSQSGFSDLPQPTPANKAGFSKGNFDARLYEVKMLKGFGEFGFDVSHATSGLDAQGLSAPNATGVSFTFIHTAEKWLGENNLNKFYIQYGRGPAKTFTSGFETYTVNSGTYIRPDAPGSYRFRVAENLIFENGKHFTVSPVILYQATDYKQYGGMQHWFSAGIRPQAQFNEYVSLAFEPFVDWTDSKETNVSDYLLKMTLAPQVTLGNHFMSRPAIRGFVTYAQWGNGFKGQIGGPDYANSTQGWTWGVQMESWW
jgi:maltoporin